LEITELDQTQYDIENSVNIVTLTNIVGRWNISSFCMCWAMYGHKWIHDVLFEITSTRVLANATTSFFVSPKNYLFLPYSHLSLLKYMIL
jgi:hypothetical protein